MQISIIFSRIFVATDFARKSTHFLFVMCMKVYVLRCGNVPNRVKKLLSSFASPFEYALEKYGADATITQLLLLQEKRPKTPSASLRLSSLTS